MTYFVTHQLGVVLSAIDEWHEFIRRETERFRALRSRLRGLDDLNHRQRALVEHALRHPDARDTIEGHQTSHNVVDETARPDRLGLMNRGLLGSKKSGRTYVFFPAAGLEQRLATLE
ncbi:MAG: hypothetical protein L6Q92_16300 [Phycisphaerae bacterium]|nr:hypothetical protein [Phycisphaerae bacterium]